MGLEQIVLLLLGGLAAGLVNGLTGFGTAITALPIWLYVLSPRAASTLAITAADAADDLAAHPLAACSAFGHSGNCGCSDRYTASAAYRAEIFQAWRGGLSDCLFGLCAAPAGCDRFRSWWQ